MPLVLELMEDQQMLEIILAVVEEDIKKMIKQEAEAVEVLDMYLVLVHLGPLLERMGFLGALEEAVLESLIKKQVVEEEALERLELQETKMLGIQREEAEAVLLEIFI